jgi:hypothetical protein
MVFACAKSIVAFAPFGAAFRRQHAVVLHQSTRSEIDFQESLKTNGEAYDNTYEPTLQGDGSQRPEWLVSSSSAPDPNEPAAFVPPKQQAAPIAKSEGDKVQEVQSHVSLMRERYAAAARNKKRTSPRTTPVATTATPTVQTTPISPTARNISSQTSSGVSQHYTSAAADATREYSAGKTEPTALGSSISLTSFIPGSPLELKHRQVTALRERNRLVQERKRLNKGLPPRPQPVATPTVASRQPSISQTKAASPRSSSSVNGYVDPRLGKSHNRVAMLRERARQAQEQKRRQQNGQ